MFQQKQKILYFFFNFILCFSLLSVFPALPVFAAEEITSNAIPNWPKGPQVSAEGAILMEASTGTILYSKNIHEELYPASTTKILTCLLAMENCKNLSAQVPFSQKAVFSVPLDGSRMGMDPGQSISVEQCLYGIMVGSANETANAVAEFISGDLESFADLMNQRAQELGCENSHFVNANGLFDENHYTSPYDLALIAREFFSNELLCRIGNTPRYHFEPTSNQPDDFYLLNKHKLITGEIPYEGIVGGKTGYTDQAGETLVTCAERNGMRLICVVMKEESPLQFTDTVSLFNYGFRNFGLEAINQEESLYSIKDNILFETDYDIFGCSDPFLSPNSKEKILLPNTITMADVESTVLYSADNSDNMQIAYSYSGTSLGKISVDISSSKSDSASPDTTDAALPTRIYIDIRRILTYTVFVTICLLILFSFQSLSKSYYFSRKKSIWKGKRDSKRRHKR